MNNIFYYSGNIFTAPIEALAHCANCQCTFGSGIAKTIRETYPEAYEADCKTKKGDENKLGLVSAAVVRNPRDRIRMIYNIYGQLFYGAEKRHANYESIYNGFELVRKSLAVTNSRRLGIPYKMASDRAGGDWRVIESMILSVFETYSPGVLICRLPGAEDDFVSKYFEFIAADTLKSLQKTS